MRRTIPHYSFGGFPVNPTTRNYELDRRYTQLPSPELNLRRPCLDPVMNGGHVIVRRPRLEEGVSFCEPIQPDWEW